MFLHTSKKILTSNVKPASICTNWSSCLELFDFIFKTKFPPQYIEPPQSFVARRKITKIIYLMQVLIHKTETDFWEGRFLWLRWNVFAFITFKKKKSPQKRTNSQRVVINAKWFSRHFFVIGFSYVINTMLIFLPNFLRVMFKNVNGYFWKWRALFLIKFKKKINRNICCYKKGLSPLAKDL